MYNIICKLLERYQFNTKDVIMLIYMKRHCSCVQILRRYPWQYIYVFYLKRLASRSHSSKHKISPSRHGPLTLRMMERFKSSRKVTRTWVTLPVLPVLPRTLSTCWCTTREILVSGAVYGSFRWRTDWEVGEDEPK